MGSLDYWMIGLFGIMMPLGVWNQFRILVLYDEVLKSRNINDGMEQAGLINRRLVVVMIGEMKFLHRDTCVQNRSSTPEMPPIG